MSSERRALLGLTLLPLALPAVAQQSEWKPVGLVRLRQEGFQWFTPADSAGRQKAYTFTSALIRAGAIQKRSDGQIRLEVSIPALFDLPTRASAPAPAGGLGPGANLRSLNGSQNVGFFLKQGFREFTHGGQSLKLGRFEFGDGRDVVPKDASLAWTKDQRLSDRLLGSLGGTPVGRSYDGVQFGHARGGETVTALLASPTRGVFDLDGQSTLSKVKVAYLGKTRFTPTSESRLFGVAYEDRRGVKKADNAGTLGDLRPIRLVTLGGATMGVRPTPSGPVDASLWGAIQGGDWGGQKASAASALGEVGWRPKSGQGKFWLKAGALWCSGDGNASDDKHGTFYPLLVAPKLYARPPFYAFANVDDRFLTARYLPRKDLSLRLEHHNVALATGNDLWYQGFGPYEPSGNFGLSGRPSGGKTKLGELVDLAVDWNPSPSRQVSLHVGHTRAREAVRQTFPRGDAWFGFLEVTRRW